jgi:uncharacterized protein YbjT (DUF2867 family)
VQIALGDLGDPGSFRNALRGVDTVVHLGASIRDQKRGSIEELNGVATLRLVRAAERLGARRFVFFSAKGATLHSRTRFMRAKALARDAVEESDLETTIFDPSIVYSSGDPFVTLVERLSWLPAMPIPGSGKARCQPVWAEDAAACVMAALDDGQAGVFELAGPETMTYDHMVRTVIRARGRRRRLLHVPLPLARALLRAIERLAGESAFATREEIELLEVDLVSERGIADAERLGVRPRCMAEVLRGSGPSALQA